MFSTCIAFSDWYLAALFYDNVLPLPLPPTREEFLEMAPQLEHMEQVLPPWVSVGYLRLKIPWTAAAAPLYPDVFEPPPPQTLEGKEQAARRRSELLLLRNDPQRFASAYLDDARSLFHASRVDDSNVEYFGTSPFDVPLSGQGVMLAVANVAVVNPRKLSWNLVKEFRQDEESRKRLRRLRAFAVTNYTGKSRSFIEDDLLTRIEDHRAAAHKWGLETVQSTLTAGASEKVLLGGVAGMLAATAGVPLSASAAVGAAAALSGVVVQLVARRKLLSIAQNNDAIRYFVDVSTAAAKASGHRLHSQNTRR